jgi:ketosteroid isomerase-like protein
VPLEREHVRRIVETYITAWQQQDPELIVTIFTETAAYHERVLEDPIRTRPGIRRYWQEKVVKGQARIDCRVLSLYLDGDTAIVEWEVHFDDKEAGVRKRMREVAILEFAGGLIESLREYWASEALGPLAP